ncbi:MAG: DUF262 domain-containing protein [Gammaproteobacteria bacterium]|nr:DUF262 domain-containing protein [Gammaproteobacteria bacterium]
MLVNDRHAVDLDLEPIDSEDEDYESAPPDYQIATYPADFTLEVLHQKWKSREILVPEFQRRFVWKQTQASKLIESFLVGLPVPAIFFYSEKESRKYLVIDGQQRLKSIFFYLDGYYGQEKDGVRTIFRLKGLNRRSQFHEKSFEDLSEEDQRGLRNSVLRAFIVQQLNPDDDTSMYHIFERLNTGGTLLANQEIRNCVYHGNFSSFLDEINEFEDWRQVLGKKDPDPRKKDVELILRFLAMRKPVAYKNPMKDFLSKYMQKNQNPSKKALMRSRIVFERTCRAVIGNLGEKPFHVRAGLNAAVFDAVMTAFSNHLEDIPEDIHERYKKLILDEDFDRHTRSSTTNVDVVQRRLKQAAEKLFDS